MIEAYLFGLVVLAFPTLIWVGLSLADGDVEDMAAIPLALLWPLSLAALVIAGVVVGTVELIALLKEWVG